MALDDILVTVGADISNYVQGLERAAQATQRFESSLGASSAAVNKQSSALKGQGSDLRATDSAYSKYANSARKAGDATRSQGVDLKAADKAYKEYLDTVRKTASRGYIASTAMVSSASIMAAAMAGLVLVASNFEDAFIGVQKTVEGTPEQFAHLESEIRGLTRELPRSAVEIAGVAEEAGRLGIKREDIAQFSKTMVMMGDASDLSASQAAQSMARLMNIMGTSQADVERLGSAITHMGNNAATSESEILEMSRRLAGASKQVGITESELVAMSASMSELGIRAEAGGTAMQKTILTMNTAVKSGGEELDTFAKTAGMTSDEFKAAFEDDAMGAIIAFVGGLDDINQSGGDVASTLADVSLNNERTMDTLLRLSTSAETMADNVDMANEAWNKGTALAEEAKNQYESLTSQIKLIINRLMEVALVIGVPLMGAFKQVLEWMEPFIYALEGLAEMFDGLSDNTKKWIGIAVMAAPVMAAFLAGVVAINSGMLFLSTTIKGATIASIAWRTALTLLSGPVGWLVGTLTLLGGAVVWLAGTFQESSEETRKLAEDTDNLTDSVYSLSEEIDNSSKAYRENNQDISSNSNANRRLVDDVMDLVNAEKLSTEEKMLLNSKVDSLNDSMEGLNLAYDEQTGKLNMNKDVLKERIDLMENEAKLAESQNRLKEIAEERNKVDMKMEETNKLRERTSELMEEQGGMTPKFREQIGDLEQAERELRETHEELGDEFEIVQEQMIEAQMAVDKAVLKGIENQTLAYEDLSDSSRESMDELIEKHGEMKESAFEMFDKISDKAELSAEEMRDILEHNINAFNDWEENLDILAEKGALHLLEHFEELGPEHAAELQEIVDDDTGIMEDMESMMRDQSRKSAESLLEEFDIADDAKEALIKIVQEGGDAYEQELLAKGLDEFTANHMDEVAEALGKSENKFRTTSEKLIEAGIKDPFVEALRSGDFESYGEDTVGGWVKGAESKSSDPETAIGKIMEAAKDEGASVLEIHSPSRVFFGYGQDTVQGFIDGIDNLAGGLLSKIGGLFTDLVGKSDDGMSNLSKSSDRGVNVVDRIFGRMPGNTNSSMSAMLNRMKSKGASQRAFMGRLPNQLTSPFNSFKGRLSSIGSNGMSGLLSGLNSRAGAVLNRARSIANSVANTMKNALKIKSPSRVTMGIGSDTTEGLVIGLDKKIKDVSAISRRMAEAAKPEDIRLGSIEYDYRTNNKRFNSFNKAVEGSVDVNSRDEFLIEAINGLRRDMKSLRVEMDGRVVGEITEPHVTNKQNRKNNPRRNKRRGGRY